MANTSGEPPRRPRAAATALLFVTNLPHIVVGVFVSGFVGMLAAGAVASWTGAAAAPYPWWWFTAGVIVWVLCGFLMLRPSGERWLVRRMLRWEPVELEEQLSSRVAAEVAYATGMDLRQFDFYRTNDPEEFNALAIGGRTVAVTSLFLDMWRNDEVIPEWAEAFIAHELGHHAGQRVRAGVMLLWLRAPAGWFGAMWRNASADVSGVLIKCGLAFIGLMVLLGLAVSRPLILLALVAVVVVFVLLRYLSARSSQAEEFRADEFAAACGYAQPLAAFLNAVLGELDEPEDRTWQEDLFGTHPSMASRIEHLRPLIESDAETG